MKAKFKPKIKSFTSGFLVASFFSSLFIYGGTLIDGIYEFASGEVISATEMNENFNLLKGQTIIDATNTSPVSYIVNTQPQQCENGTASCSAGYVDFGAEITGTIDTRTDPSSSTLYSATASGAMSYVTIPSDGFYEIVILASPDSHTISPHISTGDTTRLEANFVAVKFDTTDSSLGAVTSNMSAMKTPRIDGNPIMSPIHNLTSFYRGDLNWDGAEDVNTSDIEAGVKNELYLRENDGIAIFYWLYHEGSNATSTDGMTYNIGSIRLKIRKILN